MIYINDTARLACYNANHSEHYDSEAGGGCIRVAAFSHSSLNRSNTFFDTCAVTFCNQRKLRYETQHGRPERDYLASNERVNDANRGGRLQIIGLTPIFANAKGRKHVLSSP
jgi:hypothetical protein